MSLLRALGFTVGLLLLVGSLGGSMWVSATQTTIATWSPFVWGAIAGLLLLNIEERGTIGKILHGLAMLGGGVLLLGAIGGSIWITVNSTPIMTWTPFIWSGIIGFLIFGGAMDRTAKSSARNNTTSGNNGSSNNPLP